MIRKAGAVLICGALTFAPLSAAAQSSDVEGEIAVPIEIVLDAVEGEVRCRPPRARLPIEDVVEFTFINLSDQAIMFVAPEFFIASEILETSGLHLEASRGGFIAEPESTVRVKLRTPEADEYGYACSNPGEPPTAQSSGFLVVGSLDEETVQIPPRPQEESDRSEDENPPEQ